MPTNPLKTLAQSSAAALALALAALPAVAQDPAAGGGEVEVTRTDGDWQTVCRVGGSPCFIRQRGKAADGQEVTEMSIRKVPPQQTEQGTVESVINVIVPLGVLLQQGLSIQIDAAEPQVGGFALCAPDGCVLREPLPNAMVEGFRRGVTAKISFAVPGAEAPQVISADISLRGFTAAYGALQP